MRSPTRWASGSSREFRLAPGDLVAFTQNRYRDLGVRNGQRAEVVAVHSEAREVLVRLTETVREDHAGHIVRGGVPVLFHDGARVHEIPNPERAVVLTAEDVERGLIRLDYVRTVDAAQGLTVDRAVVLAHYETQRLNRQWAAVAFTRARHDLRVVLSAEGAVQVERATPTWERAHWPHASEDRDMFLDRDTVAAVLAQTERLLARDRPGSTTLGYAAADMLAQDARQRYGHEHDDPRHHGRTPAHVPQRT